MARKNVSVPDDLLSAVSELLPDLNVSGVLQDALRRVLAGECGHPRLVCSDCGSPVGRTTVAGESVGAFYRDLLHELGPLVDQGGTAEGAARIAKRLAAEQGIPGVDRLPLPRPPRSARESHRR